MKKLNPYRKTGQRVGNASISGVRRWPRRKRYQLMAFVKFAASSFESDFEHIVAKFDAAEFGNCRSGFVTFHPNVTEAAAFAAEHIGHEFNGMHFSKFREQSDDAGFGRVTG